MGILVPHHRGLRVRGLDLGVRGKFMSYPCRRPWRPGGVPGVPRRRSCRPRVTPRPCGRSWGTGVIGFHLAHWSAKPVTMQILATKGHRGSCDETVLSVRWLEVLRKMEHDWYIFSKIL